MRKLLVFLTVILMFVGCGVTKNVPTETKIIYQYKDSTIVHYKDSTITIEVPVEKDKDVVVVYDTLKMETTVATATAYVDTTTQTLKGCLKNKEGAYLTKIIYLPSQEHIVYKDSIVTQEVPVEVEKLVTKYPKTYWPLLGFFVLALIGIAFKVYLKFKTGK